MMVIDYLAFESVWKHTGIIYLNCGHSALLMGKGNLLVLFRVFQTALNSVCAMILSLRLVLSSSMGNLQFLLAVRGCYFKALSAKLLG